LIRWGIWDHCDACGWDAKAQMTEKLRAELVNERDDPGYD